MSTRITFDRSVHALNVEGMAGHVEQRPKDPTSAADGTSIRWVFAATMLFWVVVYAAGRSFF